MPYFLCLVQRIPLFGTMYRVIFQGLDISLVAFHVVFV